MSIVKCGEWTENSRQRAVLSLQMTHGLWPIAEVGSGQAPTAKG